MSSNGVQITYEAMRQLTSIFLDRPEVSLFEAAFLNDARGRFVKYGNKMRLSQKQEAIIAQVYLRSQGILESNETEDLG